MKSTYVVLIIAAIIIIGGGAYWYSKAHTTAPVTATSTPVTDTSSAGQTTPTKAPASTGTGTTVTTTTVTTTPTPTPSSAPTAAPVVDSFTVNGNDASADVTTINVKKGATVHITFGADAGTTYHGGLDFRSSVVSTGSIVPGSTKTVTFTADQSFSFTPYWPATNIAKPYTINVVVS